MKEHTALMALSALSHPARLRLFRLLLETGPDGLAAGKIAQNLGIAPNALSFHLTQLRDFGLLVHRRNGRQIVYSADFTGMQNLIGYLSDNCFQHSATKCSPGCSAKTSPKRGQKSAAGAGNRPAATGVLQ